MTTRERIAEKALEVAAGHRLRAGSVDLHTEHGWCLAATRRIVELAHRWSDGAFYRRFGTERVERPAGVPATAWWARDLERSLRNAGYAVPGIEDAEPGALLFNYQAAPFRGVFIGHVGILTHGDLVLENINPEHRPRSLRRAGSTMVLTPLEAFPVTTTIHLPLEQEAP